MTARARSTRVFAALAPLLLVAGLSSCSDDKADDTTAPTESAAASPVDTAPVVDPAPVDTSAGAEPSAAAAPSGGVKLTDGEAPAERTIMMGGDTMTPNALSIKVGEIVTFRTGDELHAVIVGDLDGATVNKGLYETFVFNQPGTYPVRDDLTSATATITVS